jgi:hypothetical protein
MAGAGIAPSIRVTGGVRAVRLGMPLLIAGVTAGLLWRGWDFYRLGLEARLEHPDYRALRPSGLIGNGLGYAGAAIILLNLLYLARRKHLFTLGSMRMWLDLHVGTGLLGAVLVAFHSAFQLRASIARISAVSLAIVVGTGLVGRFLHALIGGAQKRSMPGAAKALDERVPGLGPLLLAAVDAFPPTQLPANASHLRALSTIPAWRRQARDRRDAVRIVARGHAAVAGATGARAAELARLIARAERAASADVRAVQTAAILRSWRSIHRLFAILMLLAVAVHVGVAWHYGYRWIFSHD